MQKLNAFLETVKGEVVWTCSTAWFLALVSPFGFILTDWEEGGGEGSLLPVARTSNPAWRPSQAASRPPAFQEH